jgi:uncharacterized cupin superfamily protein
MVPQARLALTENGLVPQGEGWFVVNAREARWWHSVAYGSACYFEGDPEFPELVINVNVLGPGQSKGMYHAENSQEDFLVLSGECLLLVEGEERTLKTWDFVHCPPWTEHVFIGVGPKPCILLAVGARVEARGLEAAVRFPVLGLALEHAAGVAKETTSPQEANVTWPPYREGRYREGDLP